jgi:hypothetical protein
MIGRIIELDPADDPVGAIDRIEWAHADRVVLVLPAACAWREFEFARLAHAARSLGVEVAVATRSIAMRRIAREVGLSTFVDAAQATQKRWLPNPAVEQIRRLTPPRRFRPNSLRRFFARPRFLRAVVGVVATLVSLTVVAAAAIMFVPRGTVTLSADSEMVQSIVPVTIDPDADDVDLADRIVPGRRVDVIVEGRIAMPASGKRDVPRFRAAGKVLFFNDLTTPYRVPANTVVRTSGSSVPARFVTTQEIEVPPGGRVEAPIEAVDEGSQGNVGPNAINQVEGVASLAVRVVNQAETSGGGSTVVRAVTQADIDRAEKDLRAQLFAQAVEKMKELPDVVDGGLYVVPETVFLADVLDETADRFVTEQADEVNVSTRIQVAALAVSPADLNTLARDALEARTPEGFSLLSAQAIRGDAAEEGSGRRVTYFMSARGRAGAEIDVNEVRRIVAGKPRGEAQSALLQQFALSSTPRMTLQPEWWARTVGRMPWITLRIDAEVRRE